MSPDERKLLEELFERTRTAADAPRDPQAEALIAETLSAQPHAPYLLAQAVILQDQALRAATDHVHDLERQIADLQARSTQPPQTADNQQGGSSFLGGLFGGSRSVAPQSDAAPRSQPPGPWGAEQRAPYQPAQQMQPQPQAQSGPLQSGPWGQAAPSAGGGFLRGAMGTAAGVAGGMLLANSLGSLFGGGGHGLFGGSANAAPQEVIEENVVNNYYGSDATPDNKADDTSDDNGFFSDADMGDDSADASDDSYDA